MKAWSVRVLLLSACILIVCSAHTTHLGRTCPDVQAFPNLSIDKILGVWYVVYNFDTSNTCLVWNLTKSTTEPDRLKLTESRQLYVLDAAGIDHKHSITGNLDTPNPEIPSKMRIRWPTSLTGKADFIVFDTDYQNYLAVFQCDRAGIIHRRDTTILSRTQKIDDMFVDRVRRLLDTADVRHGALDQISHDTCRQNSANDWHTEGELLGLLPSQQKGRLIKELGSGVKDYDISEIEILGEGISAMSESFRGSMQKKSNL